MPVFVSGFSLIELLVTVAVLGVVLAIGVPSFRNVIAGNQVSAAANDFLATLNFARTEAIRRGVRVTVCKGVTAVDQCDTSVTSDWKDGWIVFVDRITQIPPQIEDPVDILSRGGGSYSGSMHFLGQTSTPTGIYASFAPDGSARSMNGDFLTGYWRVCSVSHSEDDRRARDINITAAGRSSIDKPTGISDACLAP